MTEQEAITHGSYCHELLEDDRFNTLVSVCEAQLSLDMLQSQDVAEREKTYQTYQGLKTLLELMQQFVIVKDQIVARQEEEEKENK